MGYAEDILAHYGSQEIDFGELGSFIVNKYGDGEGKICAQKFEQIMVNLLTLDGYYIAKYLSNNYEAEKKLKWRYVTNLKDGIISEV